MNIKYLPTLSKYFTTSRIRRLNNPAELYQLRNILLVAGFNKSLIDKLTISEIFDAIYDLLRTNHRTEYVYKNVITKKLLLKRHKKNTASILGEFRINKCKADVVLLNGTSNVYEIKTEFDKLDRLRNQLKTYKKVFDKIYVVTHENHLKAIKKILPNGVGLLLLTNKYNLKCIRKAISNKHNVDPRTIMSSLRKDEYLKILNEELGYIPDVPNTKIFKKSLKLISKLPPKTVHDKMVKLLKKRNILSSGITSNMPKSLRYLGLNLKLNINEQKKIYKLLNSKLGGTNVFSIFKK